jgi:hypothetical protein
MNDDTEPLDGREDNENLNSRSLHGGIVNTSSGSVANEHGVAAGERGVAIGNDVHGNVIVANDEANIFIVDSYANNGKSADNINFQLVEHNYLLQMQDWFYEMQRQPLVPDEEQILNLKAQIFVEPKFRVFELASRQEQKNKDGKLTSNITKLLMSTKNPVVVLGDPGAGKSTSLLKVMLSLIEDGIRKKTPRLPVYLRLGTFTQKISDENSVAIEFAKESLRKLGGHAIYIQAHLEKYLSEGRIVFLLDAMDEMPRDQIEKRFNAITRLRSFSGNKVIFACRKLDFPETFPFQRAVIQPFDHKQVKLFLRKTLGERGKYAGTEILSPANKLRDMAGNPFFLKLFALFYDENERLPNNRAELIQIYEDQVYKRAALRATMSDALDQQKLRLVLSRLAYMITISGRGVTFPIHEFKKRFLPMKPTEGEEQLKALIPIVDKVLDVAISERLLRIDHETSIHEKNDAYTADNYEVVSFHHHRLQEYYTAIYLNEAQPSIDWKNQFDDIWWQEILIMLFGISKNPNIYMNKLLQNIPRTPIVCQTLGQKLSDLFTSATDPDSTSVVNAMKELISLDPYQFYGITEPGRKYPSAPHVLLHLRNIGILPSDKPYPSEDDILHITHLQPEPDNNEFADHIRLWIETRNTILLDRIELGAECYRNALGKIDKEVASIFERILLNFSKCGNTWETVRAIQISGRIPGIDLYSIVEPPLISKGAWCRREAMAVVATYPSRPSVSKVPIGFILFLQFIKGELLTSIPKLFQIIIESPRLLWYVPGIIFLSSLSIVFVISPFISNYALLTHAPLEYRMANQLLGIEWTIWAFIITSLIAIITYILRVQFNIPLMRTTLLILSMYFAIPVLIKMLNDPLIVWGDSISFAEFNMLQLQERVFYMIKFAFGLTGTFLVSIVAIFAPQILEIAGIYVLATLSIVFLGTFRILKAPIIYIRELLSGDDYMTIVQTLISSFPLVFSILSLILALLILCLYKPVIALVMLALFACVNYLLMRPNLNRQNTLQPILMVGLFMVVSVFVFLVLKIKSPLNQSVVTTQVDLPILPSVQPLEGMRYFLRDKLPTTLVSIVGLVIFYLGMRYLFQWGDSTLRLAITQIQHLFGIKKHKWFSGFDFEIIKRTRDVDILRKAYILADDSDISTHEKIRLFRELLAASKSDWVRSVLYQEIAKNYRLSRQKQELQNREVI